ncbi:MAG: YafY family protein [Bacillota bacterium]|nr:YafY family protein [Bacillota bacterium]
MKIDRMLYILLSLLNKDQVTAAELAEHFQVSVRTIYRDIEALNMAGIPIYAQQGSGGGFSILENYKLDKQLLKEDEVASIIAALKGMATTVDDNKLTSIIEKMKAVSKPSKEILSKEVVLDFSPWGSSKRQKEKLKLIKKGIETNRVLAFKYTNLSNKSSDRVVEPINLIFRGYSWYLNAYCRKKEAVRVFRLSRISGLEILEETYEPKEELFSKEDISFGMNKFKPSNNKFIMKFSPKVMARVQDSFDEEQIEYLEDGCMRVEVDYPEDEWTYGFILSFGSDAEVLGPQHLRDIIKEKSIKIYNLYK